jgi:hypothetical protein
MRSTVPHTLASIFRKIIVTMPRSAANDVSELELGRDSKGGGTFNHDCEILVMFITRGLSGNSKNML